MKTQVLIILDVKDDAVAFELLSKLNLVVTGQSEIVDTTRFLELLHHPNTKVIRTATEKVR